MAGSVEIEKTQNNISSSEAMVAEPSELQSLDQQSGKRQEPEQEDKLKSKHGDEIQAVEIIKGIKNGAVSTSMIGDVVSSLKRLYADSDGKWWISIARLIASTRDNFVLEYLISDGIIILNDWIRSNCKEQMCQNISSNEDIKEDFTIAFLKELLNFPVEQQSLNAHHFMQTVNDLTSSNNIDIQGNSKTLIDTWKSVLHTLDKRDESSLTDSFKVKTKEYGSPNESTETNCPQLSKVTELKCDQPESAGLGISENGVMKSMEVSVPFSHTQNAGEGLDAGNVDTIAFDSQGCDDAGDYIPAGNDRMVVDVKPHLQQAEGEPKIEESSKELVSLTESCMVISNVRQSSDGFDADLAKAVISSYSDLTKAVISSESLVDNDKTMGCCGEPQFHIAAANSMSTSMVSSINSSVSDVHPISISNNINDNSTRFLEVARETAPQNAFTANSHRVNCNTPEASGTSSSAEIHDEALEKAQKMDLRSNSRELKGVKPESIYSENIERNRDSDWSILEKTKFEETSRATEIDLSYVEDDALEVARQVAREVEQEVESMSSPEKNAESDHAQSDTTYSIGHSKDPLHEEEHYKEKLSKERNLEAPICPSMELDAKVQADSGMLEHNKETETVSTLKDFTQDSESCKMTITSQESISDDEKETGKRNIFDLNEDIGGEDDGIHVSDQGAMIASAASNCNNGIVTTPIPVAAVSKGLFDLPTSPLNFKGELGWRGSAATSAFRPACRGSDRAHSTEENSPIKPDHFAMELDLNMPYDDDNVDIGKFFKRNDGDHLAPTSAGLASCDSSIEVSSSRQVERLNWDLNRVDGSDDSEPLPPHAWRNMNIEGNDTLHKPDLSTSPSTSGRPVISIIDLNEDPPTEDVSTSVHGDMQRNHRNTSNSEFRLMGSNIDLENAKFSSSHLPNLAASLDFSSKREFLNGGHPFLVSGSSSMSSVGNLNRMLSMPTMTFPTSQMPFPFNGMSLGSSFPVNQSALSSSLMPYTVETLGSQISPQMSLPFSRAPSFLSASSGPGTNGMLRPNFDLNSGFTADYHGNETRGNTRQLLLPSGHMTTEDQMRMFQQVATSSSPLKRKEPDSPWDPYQSDYKHTTHWR